MQQIKFSLLILLLYSINTIGQVSISFPMEKAVFQRNSSNQASIYIAGSVTSSVDAIEARLINPTNETVAVNWTVIQTNPTFNYFYGSLSNVSGGWYRLEVRGKSNGIQVGNIATLSRVGVGEVFLIAGQSNAQGLPGNQGEVGASDERVLSHNTSNGLSNILCENKFPDYPSFTQIFTDGNATRSYISKTSANPWVYGKLGDNLTSRLGVPVVFFNAGATASATQNWMESADGAPTNSFYINSQYCATVGMPYSNLKKVMNYYASMFGARAVLWHQGETDNYGNVGYSNYLFNLNYVINKSRSDLGSNISWVISKASVWNKDLNGGTGNPNSTIISAQQDIVNTSNNIFSGPSTDDILGSQRGDEVHFYGSGLVEVANRWNASLDNTFFSSATPIAAKVLPQLTISCGGNNYLVLTAPAGYSSYKWVRIDTGNTDFEDVSEASSQSISRLNGTYRCYLTDSNGNITVTASYTVQNVAGFCGTCSALTYVSNLTPTFAENGWGPIENDKSNGENAPNDGNTITLNGVTYSKGIGVNANSTIKYNLAGNYGRFISDIGVDDEVNNNNCNGGTVRFEVYKDNVLAYQGPIMNTTSNTISLNLDVSGTSELKLVVTDAGDGFCADHADWAGARLHCVDIQAPTAPSNLTATNIGQNCLRLSWGASTDNMELFKYYIYRNGSLIDSVGNTTLSYNVAGLSTGTNYNFSVVAKDYSGNTSTSNTLSISTLFNIVILATNETLNVGQSTLISSGNCNGNVLWSSGQTGSTISVSPSDTTSYSAVCVTNGCTSASSNIIKINVIPNCKSNYTFVSTANDFASPTINYSFQASNNITATNQVTNRSKIEYKAAKSVILNPGFEASGSAVFKASISNCPN